LSSTPPGGTKPPFWWAQRNWSEISWQSRWSSGVLLTHRPWPDVSPWPADTVGLIAMGRSPWRHELVGTPSRLRRRRSQRAGLPEAMMVRRPEHASASKAMLPQAASDPSILFLPPPQAGRVSPIPRRAFTPQPWGAGSFLDRWQKQEGHLVTVVGARARLLPVCDAAEVIRGLMPGSHGSGAPLPGHHGRLPRCCRARSSAR